jgi:hypothetical protein
MLVDLTECLTVLKEELQGKDKLTAEISDNVMDFNVNLRLSMHTCSGRHAEEKENFQPWTRHILRLLASSTLSCGVLNLIKQ